MIYAIAANTVLLLSCGYAVCCGGYWERFGAGVMFVASMITTIVVLAERAYGLSVFLIDIIMLAALLYMALRSDRFWPLWAVGFHSLGVATHAAVLADAAIAPLAKAHALGLWSYLVFLSLVVGTRSYQQSHARKIAAAKGD